MKLLLVLVVLLAAVWFWRRGRLPGQNGQGEPGNAQTPPTPEASTAPMCSCLHCRVHFPAEEAVQGELGLYCSSAHRVAAGDRAPSP